MASAPSATAAFMDVQDYLSPEAKRAQVDSALEFALEGVLKDRPNKPLTLLAKKLRQWDDAINGQWPLRAESEKVFTKADKDGSGQLNLAELTALREDPTFSAMVLQDSDTDLSGSISLQEWLLMMKGNLDRMGEGPTKKLLEAFEFHLKRR